jgi:hypothetical protein
LNSPRFLLAVCFAAVAGLTGCQTAPKVQTEFDSTEGFATMKTFAVLPLPKNIPGVDPGLVLRIGPAVKEAVRGSMKGKGYTETTTTKETDIAILVHGRLVPKTDVTDWGFTPYYGRAGWYGGYNYGAYGGSNVTVDQYNQGTIIVEVYDVKTSKMIWVGWMEDRADDDPKREKQAANVANAIAKILASYPAVGAVPPPPPPEKK